MEPLRIRPRTPDDDQRIVEINQAINVDRPPLSVEELRHNISAQPPEAQAVTVVGERGGRVVGDASWNRMIYLKEQNNYWMSLYVDPAHWNGGIGTALFEHLLPRVRELGAARLYTQIREDLAGARDFATHRGFIPTGHGDRLSRLEVRSARLDRCRAAAQRVRSEGIRIATLAELGTEDETLLRAVHALDDATSADVPSTEEWSSQPFDQWRHYMLEAPGFVPEAFWLALDGERPVGLAMLEMRSGGAADNAYTAVDRQYRGRGIARALKLCTVEWAAEHGIEYIYTGNDPANQPMLAVNIDLGYQPLPANVELVKDVETE